MIRIRTFKEQKYFQIKSSGVWLSGHGYSDYIEGKVYCEEPFISEEDCQIKLNSIIKEWEKINSWVRPEKPQLKIYWKVLEEHHKE